eukprot:SAG31_NODE_1333_length_8743_cov_1.681050_7_plen_91_part_00
MLSAHHGVYRAYYGLSNIEQQLRAYVEDVLRSTVPKKNIDQVYEAKESLSCTIKETLERELHRYGYEILNALVVDIQPDSAVLNAMNQVH